MEAVRPALVVVEHDVARDFGVTIEVLRGVDVRAFAAAEAEDHFRADAFDRRDELVRRAEVVAVRIVRIGIRIGEDAERRACAIDERVRRVRERCVDVAGAIRVVRADEIDARLAIARRGIRFRRDVPAAELEADRLVEAGSGCAIRALQGMQAAVGLRGIDGDAAKACPFCRGIGTRRPVATARCRRLSLARPQCWRGRRTRSRATLP